MAAPRTVASILLLTSVLACSSSQNGGVRVGSFVVASRIPASAQVYVDPQDADGETVTVAVRVRDLPGVASSDVILEYDPARLVYFAWLPGELLEQGPMTVSYNVREEFPGRLRMRVARNVGATDAGTDDPVLVMVRFKVAAVGATPAAFALTSSLYDDQAAPIAGVELYAGTFFGT
jgi:hypothetical protein